MLTLLQLRKCSLMILQVPELSKGAIIPEYAEFGFDLGFGQVRQLLLTHSFPHSFRTKLGSNWNAC
jgi:hypothetical protein